MEVAEALLDASRRMSTSDVSSNMSSNMSSGVSSSGGWHSNSEVDDKTGDLPSKDSWLGGWGKRTRAFSESEGSKVKIDLVAWVAGYTGGQWGGGGAQGLTGGQLGEGGTQSLPRPGFLWPGDNRAPRVRRSSSKDVEEAMAGGLSKADIYMPPM